MMLTVFCLGIVRERERPLGSSTLRIGANNKMYLLVVEWGQLLD